MTSARNGIHSSNHVLFCITFFNNSKQCNALQANYLLSHGSKDTDSSFAFVDLSLGLAQTCDMLIPGTSLSHGIAYTRRHDALRFFSWDGLLDRCPVVSVRLGLFVSCRLQIVVSFSPRSRETMSYGYSPLEFNRATREDVDRMSRASIRSCYVHTILSMHPVLSSLQRLLSNSLDTTDGLRESKPRWNYPRRTTFASSVFETSQSSKPSFPSSRFPRGGARIVHARAALSNAIFS